LFFNDHFYKNYSITSRPIDKAEPATIEAQASKLVAFISTIFFLATFKICCLVILPAESFPGFDDPFANLISF
jgi:hypothetical protein